MRSVCVGVVVVCSLASLVARGQPMVIRPEETDEILANPGMGWQTFHRTARQDKSLPTWIPSTVHYARWGWGRVEPKPGQLDTAFLDRVLKESRESGQKLAFRVMVCSPGKNEPYHPAWLKEVGGKVLEVDSREGGTVPIPDLDDPVVLERHLDLIQRLGERYDGHPDLDHVDIGSVGWWGEWHMSGSKAAKMPTAENQKKIVDAYFAAFKKTPLLMLIGGGEMLAYATKRGAGWRADCLGDLGGFSKTWHHMRDSYPKSLRDAKAEEAWRTAPVAWESCWTMNKWVSEGWPLRYIFNYALACHASHLNNKSAPLPEGENVRAELERFLRRLGYRLVLKELTHPPAAKAGEAVKLSMKWQNTGSAPCYRPYRLAYRLTALEGGRRAICPSEVAVNHWMPGSVPLFTKEFMKEPPDLPPGDVVDVADELKLPADLPKGTYELAVGVVEPGGDKPVVRLGIKGRDAEGWYPLSRLEVRE